MKAYIHYSQFPIPGYTPREPVRLFNIAAIEDLGPKMIRVRMQFSDFSPTHDHVERIVLEPEHD